MIERMRESKNSLKSVKNPDESGIRVTNLVKKREHLLELISNALMHQLRRIYEKLR